MCINCLCHVIRRIHYVIIMYPSVTSEYASDRVEGLTLTIAAYTKGVAIRVISKAVISLIDAICDKIAS